MNKLTTNRDSLATSLASRLFGAVQEIEKACAEIRAIMLDDQDFPDLIAEKLSAQSPHMPITGDGIRRMASRIGVKHIGILEYASSPGARRLRKLSLDEQRKWSIEPLPVLVAGELEPMLIGVHNLTEEQSEQVIASDHIRTMPEQRAWVESEKVKKDAPRARSEPDPDWEVRRGDVIVRKSCTFSVKDVIRDAGPKLVLQLLADMKS